MSDARTRGQIVNRTNREVWACVSDDSGQFFAFRVLPGRQTSTLKNDVDYVRPVESFVSLIYNRRPIVNAWFKVRGCPVVLTQVSDDSLLITESNAVVAGLSRIKDGNDVRRDSDILGEYGALPTLWKGDHAASANTDAIPGFVPPAEEEVPETTTLMPGESLSIVAGRLWKEVLFWPALWDANLSKIPKPNSVRGPMELDVPDISNLSEAAKAALRTRGLDWKRWG